MAEAKQQAADTSKRVVTDVDEYIRKLSSKAPGTTQSHKDAEKQIVDDLKATKDSGFTGQVDCLDTMIKILGPIFESFDYILNAVSTYNLCPGVTLDLATSTKNLKKEHTSAQSAIHEYIQKLHAFYITHEVYLDMLEEPIHDYENETDEQKKGQIATKTAKKAIQHSKAWSMIMTKADQRSSEPVKKLFGDVSSTIAQLKLQMTTVKDTFSSVLSENKANVLEVISQAQKQLQVAKPTMDKLSIILTNLSVLEGSLNTVVQHWKNQLNVANAVKDIGVDTLVKIGCGIVQDKNFVTTAKETTTKGKSSCETYLAILEKAGIMAARDSDDDGSD